jgi:KUP system potassium uptake protein
VGSDNTVGRESVEHARELAEAAAAGSSETPNTQETSGHRTQIGTTTLSLGALGVVFGDIGTSPLYSIRETFTEHNHQMTIDTINTYGVSSLAFWALVIVISIKYLMFVMRADNHGEGGILALTALVMPKRGEQRRRTTALVGLGIFGTALLYGEGIITPAISVLSAVEGLSEVSSVFDQWIIPIAIAIIAGLFFAQSKGTAAVGKVFGPVMIVWFSTLAILGLIHIIDNPAIIQSVNPYYAFQYFTHESGKAFLSLGSIILVVTGGEALYADMGHFGRRPIMIAWYAIVLPALVLNYWGQSAYLLSHPEDVSSLFFRMAPSQFLIPLVILATFSTVIASQALISGVYSLTAQAVQLDYLPRIKILHTSQRHSGQIYLPLVNWVLMVACIGLVLGFRTASNLAAAYGIAVIITMTITTFIFYRVLIDRWGWHPFRALALCTPFLIIEFGFLSANLLKIPRGGWFALVIGFILMAQMQTWRRGRALVAQRIQRGERNITDVLDDTEDVKRVSGIAVFMFKDLGKAPPALVNNLRHNKVLHKCTLIVSVDTASEPRLDPDKRAHVTKIGPGVYQIQLEFGFMEEPDVPLALANVNYPGLDFVPEEATYFLGHESIIAGKVPGMNRAQEHLFVFLNRGADSAGRFFNLPHNRIFEVGTHVEI